MQAGVSRAVVQSRVPAVPQGLYATCQAQHSACLGSCPGCCGEKLRVEGAPTEGQGMAGSCWCPGAGAWCRLLAALQHTQGILGGDS